MDTRQLKGTYRGKVTDALLGEGKRDGDVELVLTCEFKVGEETGRLAYFGYFTEKSLPHTLKAIRTAGYKELDLSPLADEGGWTKAVPAPPDVDFVIEQEPDMERTEAGELVPKVDEAGNPLTRARVRWINSAGAIGVRTPLTVDKAKAFAAKMRSQLAAFDAKNRQPKQNGAPGRHEEPPPPTDSDAPPF